MEFCMEAFISIILMTNMMMDTVGKVVVLLRTVVGAAWNFDASHTTTAKTNGSLGNPCNVTACYYSVTDLLSLQ